MERSTRPSELVPLQNSIRWWQECWNLPSVRYQGFEDEDRAKTQTYQRWFGQEGPRPIKKGPEVLEDQAQKAPR